MTFYREYNNFMVHQPRIEYLNILSVRPPVHKIIHVQTITHTHNLTTYTHTHKKQLNNYIITLSHYLIFT